MITPEESGPDDENESIRTTEQIITTMHHLFLAVRTLKKLAAQLVAFLLNLPIHMTGGYCKWRSVKAWRNWPTLLAKHYCLFLCH